MAKGKVVIIGSNATGIEVRGGGTGATGQYLNETVVPAMAFVDAGYDVVLATPNGTKPHIDEASDSAQHFGGDEAGLQTGVGLLRRPSVHAGADVAIGDRRRP
jgi:putative intracellular protease/amidase